MHTQSLRRSRRFSLLKWDFSVSSCPCCNDKKPTYFKWGIYKWKWTDDPATSQVSERTIFMDSFKMGDDGSCTLLRYFVVQTM
ncbi:MAG: hypothetical protein HUU56_02115 [Bdellovibrionaceae bacterium]|nr:hypothetical protein [Pseudobdellovibrionaceae bacterium]